MDDLDLIAFRLMLGGMLAAFAVIPLVGISVLALAFRRRLGRIRTTILLLVALVAYAFSPFPRAGAVAAIVMVPETRFPLVRLDLALSRTAREEVVELATTGKLPVADYVGEYRLPGSDAGLAVHGKVDVIDGACGTRVFFMTLTWFSPDPYGGLEYVPVGCGPVEDPLGSGAGTAYPLDGQWYWIEAS